MDLTAFLADHALLLSAAVFLPTAYLLFKGAIARHHYDAVTGALFAVTLGLAVWGVL